MLRRLPVLLFAQATFLLAALALPLLFGLRWHLDFPDLWGGFPVRFCTHNPWDAIAGAGVIDLSSCMRGQELLPTAAVLLWSCRDRHVGGDFGRHTLGAPTLGPGGAPYPTSLDSGQRQLRGS
ncbi:hypothetical protein NDU88_003105 [Pleurodeles waltl]|uniref:Uncharacterized protein n=1 Tax=Pleurodeles waltl TaxID=8319 RepID=A0AAV7SET0_PLEWA|nr:hypothetical protein NDU88_003105 [Pleurodeles waltl]